MPTAQHSHQWIISPGPDFDEAAFDKFILDEAFRETAKRSLTRVTRGVTQTLSKGHAAGGRALYLWTMSLDLMNDAAGERIFKEVMGTMKAQLEPHRATLSMPLDEVMPEADEDEP